MPTRCPRCATPLDPDRRCPAADAPFVRHPDDGSEWGTAQQLAHRLGPGVTVAMIRNYAARYGLAKARMEGPDGRPQARYPLLQAAQIERDKRVAAAAGRRGKARRLDAGAAWAA